MTLVEPAVVPRLSAPAAPTIWGLTPQQIHDRFWAAFGVQVVRCHERSAIVEGAELFLLAEPGMLVLFRLSSVLETLCWLKPQLLQLRVRDVRPRTYREVAVTDGDQLVRFERVYRDSRARSARVALTADRDIARLWQNAPAGVNPWRWIRDRVAPGARISRSTQARMYDEQDDAQVVECLRAIMVRWQRPDTTIARVLRQDGGVWRDKSAEIADGARVVGPIWMGAGRTIEPRASVLGPAILWDDPAARPPVDDVEWQEIEPSELGSAPLVKVRRRAALGKRVFDVLFALTALLLTLPLFPLVALAILLEDGRPIFFAHRRETLGGREFPCLKFRSMKKQAAAIKAEIAADNQADGPQFFIENDPRVTRVGRIIRKLQIDELPQFLNVLLGHMSIVGPRPSPYSENQYCPQWREARLSVRPGVTGLWQVRRTRQAGLDFQEWIRFDIQYVENASWALDLRIIAETIGIVVKGILQ